LCPQQQGAYVACRFDHAARSNVRILAISQALLAARCSGDRRGFISD
jgi:hypothetical protein